MRSGGPGGQHVNKVSTAAELRFDVFSSSALAPEAKRRLAAIAGGRLTADGVLVIESSCYRELNRNRRAAFEKLCELVRRAAQKPVPRRKTKPTRGSKERRIHGKKLRSSIKRLRKSGFEY